MAFFPRYARLGAGILSAVGLVLLAAPAGYAGTTPAPADPGFCGVRVQGPTLIPNTYDFAYTMQNKCDYAINFHIVLPGSGRASDCAAVGPFASHTFSMAADDGNWYIETC